MRFRIVPVSLVTLLFAGIASAQQHYQAVVLSSPDNLQNLVQGVSGGHAAGSFYTNTSDPVPQQVQEAMWWPDLSSSAVSLNPSGANYSYANSVCGNQVGGAVNMPSMSGDHAAMWVGGLADGYVDLHPASALSTSALYGMDSGCQVGYAMMSSASMPFFAYHPFVWSGSAASAVDLWPDLPGATHGVAAACGGGHQVGWMVFNDSMHPFFSFKSHAFMWSGTAASAVDLHPASGFNASAATGTDGSQIVGYGIDASFAWHALMWMGSADSVVDLTPAGALGARALACKNGFQVGWVNDVDTGQHAAIWNGSADSMIDLDADSGSGFQNSVATGIDDNGNIVGYTEFGLSGSQAVMWVPIQENNQAPVADAGPDQTVQFKKGGNTAVLDGSGSSDPDAGDTLSYVWTNENNEVVGTSAVVTVSVAKGTHTFTLVVTDNHGLASEPDVTHVSVVDTAPPRISGFSVDPSVVKKRDKGWVLVTVSYKLSDKSDPKPMGELSVTSSDSNRHRDAFVVDAHHVKVRADKHDRRKGRVYTIKLCASDHSGNCSYAEATVTIASEHQDKRGHWDWDDCRGKR